MILGTIAGCMRVPRRADGGSPSLGWQSDPQALRRFLVTVRGVHDRDRVAVGGVRVCLGGWSVVVLVVRLVGCDRGSKAPWPECPRAECCWPSASRRRLSGRGWCWPSGNRRWCGGAAVAGCGEGGGGGGKGGKGVYGAVMIAWRRGVSESTAWRRASKSSGGGTGGQASCVQQCLQYLGWGWASCVAERPPCAKVASSSSSPWGG